jgi:hypothetical protein
MKKLLSTLLLTLLLPLESWASQCLFATPLITGASVSFGYGALPGGPAAVIAETLNPQTDFDVQAIPGASSIEILRILSPRQPSIVMAVDLFFWDVGRNKCGGEFAASTRAFFKKFQGTPMVIGKIPIGATFPEGIRQVAAAPCAPTVNALLEELCTINNNCLLYNPLDCFDQMTDPSLYFVDDLHTSHEGNLFCAEQFVSSGRHLQLRCQ